MQNDTFGTSLFTIDEIVKQLKVRLEIAHTQATYGNPPITTINYFCGKAAALCQTLYLITGDNLYNILYKDYFISSCQS